MKATRGALVALLSTVALHAGEARDFKPRRVARSFPAIEIFHPDSGFAAK